MVPSKTKKNDVYDFELIYVKLQYLQLKSNLKDQSGQKFVLPWAGKCWNDHIKLYLYPTNMDNVIIYCHCPYVQ